MATQEELIRDASANARIADRQQLDPLFVAAQDDHDGYIREVLRARDRMVELRLLHEAEAAAGHPSLPADATYCQVCGVILQVLAAMDSQYVIDHALLHGQLDQAFTIAQGA